jgi:AsmA protein
MKKLKKYAVILLCVLLLMLGFMIVFPMVFKSKFAGIVKSASARALKTEMNFSEIEVSFFTHFPRLTVTLTGFTLKSSPPFSGDTLIRARDISFGIDLWSVISGPVKITRVYLNRADILMQYNEKGATSFDVYNSTTDTAAIKGGDPSASTELKIESIAFIQCNFTYSDAGIPLKIVAHGINYRGKSDLSKDILRLASNVQIDSLDAEYKQVRYVKSKPVKADLVTTININSLDMKFEKNDLTIKNIPFQFRGELGFRKEGYDLFLSLFSMYGNEYASGSLRLVSTDRLWIAAKADVRVDLEKWGLGLGMKDFEIKGLYTLKLDAQGEYYEGYGIRDAGYGIRDTVILSIPNFKLTSTLSNGYFRYRKYPQALSGISINVSAECSNHDYRSVKVNLENIRAGFLKNKLEGYFRLDGLREFPMEGQLTTSLNLGEIRQLVPMDSLELGGFLELSLDVKGRYAPAGKLFPETILSVKLTDGDILTKYYPNPVNRINLLLALTNTSGKLSSTRAVIDPFTFRFEGKTFEVRAQLSNPDNLDYDVECRGVADLARIYKVFAVKGTELAGFIEADFKLKGRQSDAMEGRIDRLQNSGRLSMKQISLRTGYLPLPFLLHSGEFSFEQDRVWFRKFQGRYGASDISLDGKLSNVINYFFSKGQVLKGSFSLSSDYFLADELIPPVTPQSSGSKSTADSATGSSGGSVTTKSAPEGGVLEVPKDLEISLKTRIKKIRWNKLDVTDLSAGIEMKQGMIFLKDMGFMLIGCKVGMEASYGTLNPSKAFFDFHVTASDFDVQRAYNEVEMFRNLASAAGKCEGIISLDYTLKGKLDAGMKPVYPSLEGGGTVSIVKVKVMGLKLFTDMSRNLDKEKVKEPKLSKVELKTTIKNNVITLERTKLKFSGFRLRMEGESNFDGAIAFKARLGLPPLGIVGINMRILGTMDEPKFKYGKGKGEEDVEETEYSDEIPAELRDRIKSAKDEDLKEEPD